MNMDRDPCSSVARKAGKLLFIAGSSSGYSVGLKLLPVILHEIPLFSVTHTRTKLILVHLRKHLVQVPVVFLKSINCSHHACPVTSPCTVNIELTCLGIVNYLEERIDLVHARIALINHRNVDVAKSGALDGRLFIFL